MRPQTTKEKIDTILIEHNQYIDNVWKGKADLFDLPTTGKSIANLLIDELYNVQKVKGFYARSQYIDERIDELRALVEQPNPLEEDTPNE